MSINATYDVFIKITFFILERDVYFSFKHKFGPKVSLIYVIQVLTQPNVAVLPKFAMLSHLELGIVSVEVLLGLLQKSSVLNTLLFKVGNY
jgi:hypothetical protein